MFVPVVPVYVPAFFSKRERKKPLLSTFFLFVPVVPVYFAFSLRARVSIQHSSLYAQNTRVYIRGV